MCRSESFTDDQLIAEAASEIEQRFHKLHHRAHGVTQHQDAKFALQAIGHHGDDVLVHKRLAAGEADFPDLQFVALDLVEKGGDFRSAKIDERVVGRARLDITIVTGQIAQSAGVEPQGLQTGKRHLGPLVAVGGIVGVAKFISIELSVGNGRGIDHQISLLGTCHSLNIAHKV